MAGTRGCARCGGRDLSCVSLFRVSLRLGSLADAEADRTALTPTIVVARHRIFVLRQAIARRLWRRR